MSDKRIAGYVGKPFKEFIQWFADHNFEVHLFHDKNETYASSPLIEKTYALDFSSDETLQAGLVKVTTKPEFLVNVYENAVVQKARIAKYFGLLSLSEESALLATDKFLMRSRFQERCTEYSPRFALVSSWEDIETFLALPEIAFPLVLKPTNLFKSLLVTKNVTKDELRKNFDESMELIQSIYQKEHVKFEPRLLIEEYLDGPSYSLEVFTDQNGSAVTAPSAVDLIMGRDLGENDNYNYSRKLPSQLSETQQEEIQKAATAGVQALSLTSSPAHVELIYTANGPKLIEIGARTGGYRQRMHLLAQGIDLFQAQVDVAHGKLPTLSPQFKKYCAVYELFSQKEGAFKEVVNLKEVSKLPTLFYLSSKIKPGEKTGPSKKGYRTAVVAIFATDDETQFKKDTEFFEQNVTVVVQ